MRIGDPSTGLSLLIPVGLAVWIAASRRLVARMELAPRGWPTWLAAVASGYTAYLLVGLAGTELLSATSSLNRTGLTCWWVALDLCGLVVAAIARRPREARRRSYPLRWWPELLAGTLFLALAGFLLWLGISIAPNTLDGLNYHLARSVAWIERGSVGNFPTYVTRQLYYGRLEEYFTAQTLAMDGTDRFAFLPQWIAFGVSPFMAAGITALLTHRRIATLVSFVLAGTMPVAIMQATGTQNDIFLAASVLTAFAFAALLLAAEQPSVVWIVMLSASIGLAIVTKTDAAFSLGPLAVIVVWWAYRQRWNARDSLRYGAMAIAIVVVLTLPMTGRNYVTFGNANGAASSEGLVVQTANPGQLSLNVARNLLNNLDTLSPTLDKSVDSLVATIGRPTGLDHASPQTTVWRYPSPRATPSEDGSGNLLALLVVIAAVAACFSKRVRRQMSSPAVLPLLLAVVAGLLITSGVIKWEPWGARFQMMVLLPGLAIAVAVLSAVHRLAFRTLSCVVAFGSYVMVPAAMLQNIAKPLVGASAGYLEATRNQQMMRWCPSALQPYVTAANQAASDGQSDIGYVTTAQVGLLYPIYALLSQATGGGRVGLVAVGVNNQSGHDHMTPAQEPDVSIAIGVTQATEQQAAAVLTGKGYHQEEMVRAECHYVGVFSRVPGRSAIP